MDRHHPPLSPAPSLDSLYAATPSAEIVLGFAVAGFRFRVSPLVWAPGDRRARIPRKICFGLMGPFRRVDALVRLEMRARDRC